MPAHNNWIGDDALDKAAPLLKIPKELARLTLNFSGAEYITAVLDQWGIDPEKLQYLGHGAYAQAYWVKNDRKKIIKFTRDSTDAEALMNVLLKPDKSLVKVYKIAKLGPNDVHAILAEKLLQLSGSEKKGWYNFFNYVYYHNISPALYGGVCPEWTEELTDRLKADEIPSDFQKQIKQCVVWGKALESRQIDFFDLHAGNVMKRGRQDVIIELGLATAPHKKIPVITLD